MKLTSPAFTHGDQLPVKYTKDGENVSPPLRWSDAPEGTQHFVILFESPEAPLPHTGPWDHWILFNLSGELRELPEALPAEFAPLERAGHGLNSHGHTQYDGPGPAKAEHPCFITLYALSNRVNLKPGSSKGEIIRAMEPHILTQSTMTVRYVPKR